MNQRLAAVVAVLVVTGLLLVGCGRNPADPRGETATGVAATGIDVSGRATIHLAFAVDVGAPQPMAAVRAATTATPTVSFSLTHINVGSVPPSTTTVASTVPVVGGLASMSFYDVPSMPTLCRVAVTGGAIAGYPRFHGAIDTVPGVNTLIVNPENTGLTRDVAAYAFARICSSSVMLGQVRPRLVANLTTAVASFAHNGPGFQALLDAALPGIVQTILQQSTGTGTGTDTGTGTVTASPGAALSGYWVLHRSDGPRIWRFTQVGMTLQLDWLGNDDINLPVQYRTRWFGTGFQTASQSFTANLVSSGTAAVGSESWNITTLASATQISVNGTTFATFTGTLHSTLAGTGTQTVTLPGTWVLTPATGFNPTPATWTFSESGGIIAGAATNNATGTIKTVVGPNSSTNPIVLGYALTNTTSNTTSYILWTITINGTGTLSLAAVDSRNRTTIFTGVKN